MSLSDAAADLAAQFAATSMGDMRFAQAVVLLCRSDVGCGEDIWRVLYKANVVHCLPELRNVIGGADMHVCSAVVALERLLEAQGGKFLEASGGFSASNVAASCQGSKVGEIGDLLGVGAALSDGQWSARMLHRNVAASSGGEGEGSAMESLGMGGLLWGCWLLENICSACMSSQVRAVTVDEVESGGGLGDGVQNEGGAAPVDTQVAAQLASSITGDDGYGGDYSTATGAKTKAKGEGNSSKVGASLAERVVGTGTEAGSEVGVGVGVGEAAGWKLRGVRERVVEEGGQHAAGTLLRCAVYHAAQSLGHDRDAVLRTVMRCAGGAWEFWGRELCAET